MATSLNDFTNQIQSKIRDTTNGTVEVEDVRLALNRGVRSLQNEHGIYATKNRAVIDVFPTVFEYQSPSDLHDLITVYDRGRPIDFNTVKPTEFWKRLTQRDRLISVDNITGQRFLLIDFQAGQSVVLSSADTLTDNGTWAVEADSDAVNLTVDTVTLKNGAGSLNFDLDVSNSANDFAAIQNSTLRAQDLTNYENLGTLFFWKFIPDATNITSILARWGSSTSDYWENSVTASHNGQSFRNGWNRIGIPWSSATETGTPDASAVNLVYVRVVYGVAQADDTDFRIDDIRMELPRSMELTYYSTSFTQTSGAVLQSDFQNGDDTSLLEDQDDDLLLYFALNDVFEILERPNDAQTYLNKFTKLVGEVTARYPSERKRQTAQYYPMRNTRRRR